MNNTELWNHVLTLIKKETTKVSYNTWFVPTKIYSVDSDLKIVYLRAESEFYANLLRNRYIHLLEESFATVLGEKYRIIIKQEEDYANLEKEKKENQEISQGKQSVTPFLQEQRIFNPKYTFDNFVVGNSNKYAHAAALAVAESPSQAYNPLFIYGGSGLGKTHLIHAIGIYMLEHHPDINILYVSSEMFTNELIKSLQEKKTKEFKDKYRKADVLLVDDIQFLENKETTQEEFFWTFNNLYSLHKQIVITGDRPPNELTKLDERLRQRFGWNIVASISAPDYETRVAVLMKKAENAHIKVEVGDDMYQVICLIAEKIRDNIRELEGAFNRIITFSSLMHEKADLAFAKRILKDIMQGGDGVTPEKIKSVVARKYKIQVSDLDSSTRLKKIAYPRQIAMYLCRTMTDD
ncbi:MAG: chromosomal replication initiator protein DnaA, partial [Eubacteriales bacterium]|nr:chromosomal replication initiator protein DnaA [Eubacteriales bacterium]